MTFRSSSGFATESPPKKPYHETLELRPPFPENPGAMEKPLLTPPFPKDPGKLEPLRHG